MFRNKLGYAYFLLGGFLARLSGHSVHIMILLVHFSPCVVHTPTKNTNNGHTVTKYVPVKIFQILAKDRSTMQAKIGTYLRYIWVKPFTDSPLFVQKTKLGRRSRPK